MGASYPSAKDPSTGPHLPGFQLSFKEYPYLWPTPLPEPDLLCPPPLEPRIAVTTLALLKERIKMTLFLFLIKL